MLRISHLSIARIRQIVTEYQRPGTARSLSTHEIIILHTGLSNAIILRYAKVAELVDALDLGSSALRRESSSLSFRTK